MGHLDSEDICRLIDGDVSKKERETFQRHLSQCDTCLTQYNQTIKFMGNEDKNKRILTFPKVVKDFRRYWQDTSAIFNTRRWIPALATAMVLLAAGFIISSIITHSKIEKARIAHIQQRESGEVYSLSPDKSKIISTIRAGIFMEDLTLLNETEGNKDLKAKISELLLSQLGKDTPKATPLNLEQIRRYMEASQYAELFRLGIFLERSILDTFADKKPKQEEIETFLQIAREHNLPRGVLKNLEKLKKAVNAEESRKTCIAIREIFLE